MKLYVANCTHQIQTLNYRLNDTKGRGFITQSLDIGRQIQIAGELDEEQIKRVLKNLYTYGLHSIEDLKGTKHYVPLLYCIDKPVPSGLMGEVIEYNRGLLREFGTKLRREAAIATSHGMREYSPNAADNLSMSVEEEKTGTMDHGGDAPLAEGFRMSRDFGV
jgi:hypothetical protein